MYILDRIVQKGKYSCERRGRMLCDLQAFLKLNIGKPLNAPGSLVPGTPRTSPQCAPALGRCVDWADIYVQGQLCLDWAVYVDTTRQDFLAAMENGFEKIVQAFGALRRGEPTL